MIKDIFKPNYFQLFSQPMQYDLNIEALQESLVELQKRFHPDNFVNQDPALANQAILASSQINQAFVTLKEPLSRAIYLLGLHGLTVDLVHDTKFTPEFLMAQIELREEIAEAEAEFDIDKLIEIESNLRQQKAELVAEINSLFTQQKFALIAEQIKKLAFYDKLEQYAGNIIAQL